MELVISIIAIAISFVSIIVSVVIYQKGVQREKKEATLNTFNILQEQIFDYLNQYTYAQIREVCNEWQQAIADNKNKHNGQVINLSEKQQNQ